MVQGKSHFSVARPYLRILAPQRLNFRNYIISLPLYLRKEGRAFNSRKIDGAE